MFTTKFQTRSAFSEYDWSFAHMPENCNQNRCIVTQGKTVPKFRALNPFLDGDTSRDEKPVILENSGNWQLTFSDEFNSENEVGINLGFSRKYDIFLKIPVRSYALECS